MELACYLLPDLYRAEAENPDKSLHERRPELGSQAFEDGVAELLEFHQDEVFGEKSRMVRGDYITVTGKKSEWLFHS